MLRNQQCDAILFASNLSGDEVAERLSEPAQTHLQTIPRIAFSTQAIEANVQFQMGIPGINAAGEHCRIDNVSMPLKKAKPNDWISTKAILEMIRHDLTAQS